MIRLSAPSAPAPAAAPNTTKRTLAVAIALAGALLLFDPHALAATPKRCALALAALILTAITLAHPQLPPRPTPTAVSAWLGLSALSAASLLWSSQPAWQDAALWLSAAAIALCVSQWPATETLRVARLSALVIVLGSAAAVLGQFVLGARGVALHGFAGNPNWLGITIASALPLSLDAATTFSRKRNVARAALLIVAIAAMLLASSGAAWVALAAAATIHLKGRDRLAAVCGGALLIAMLWWRGPLANSLAGRQWIWQHSLGAALQHPWLGSGLGSFPSAYLTSQGQALAHLNIEQAAHHFVNAQSAHNDWLQLWLELGLVAPLLLAATIIIAWRNNDHRATRATLLIIAICACADIALRLPAVAALLAFCMASQPPSNAPAQRRRRASAGPARDAPKPRRALIVALAAAAVACALSARRWIAERALFDAQDATLDQQLGLLDRAHQLDPSYGQAQFALAVALLDLGQTQPAREQLRQSLHRLYNAGSYVALGNAWSRDDQPQQAAVAYRRALVLQPASFRAHLNLASALHQLKNLPEAEHHYQLARELQPHHPKLHRLRQQLDALRADLESQAP